MRVLFATTRGAGHFGPLVPFADEIAALPPIDEAVGLIQRSAAGQAIR